ncbi:MAG: RnfABCDGE type electron transport complex subunit B [Candidatus Omnitrophica bacterium]|nr:RnfABCDGE type electron transport complex subunit B [Candidatus Omnitrophota bacterium]
MKAILLGVMALSGLGLAFGVLLAWVSKKFHVQIDPRIEKVGELLPGVNCGACGFAGCLGYAEALVNKTATLAGCPVSTADTKKQIAQELGVCDVDLHRVTPLAVVACGGGIRAKDKFKYQGLADCRVAVKTMGGPKNCKYACVGQGTCVTVCPVNAISMQADGLPLINPDLCVGCTKCVAVCPSNIIYMLDRKKKVYIKCRSHDKGAQVMKNCKSGCIGCMKCVKECPVKCITIVDNLAVIDHEKCINCKKCVAVCPTKCIAVL